MNYCPYCSDKLLRHLTSSNMYWFCPRCRQTIPRILLRGKKVSPPIY